MKVARAYDGLQEEAKTLLRDEFSRRSLEPPLIEEEAPELIHQTLTTVARYRDLSEAIVARSVLESAGLFCFLQDENTIRLDWGWSNALGGLRLQVGAQDADRALELLSRPRPKPLSSPKDRILSSRSVRSANPRRLSCMAAPRKRPPSACSFLACRYPPDQSIATRKCGIASTAVARGWTTKSLLQPPRSLPAAIDLNPYMESSSQAAVLSPATLSAPIISAQHLGKIYGSGKLKVGSPARRQLRRPAGRVRRHCWPVGFGEVDALLYPRRPHFGDLRLAADPGQGLFAAL